MFGGDRAKMSAGLKRTARMIKSGGFGGHFRAVQGFKYIGDKL